MPVALAALLCLFAATAAPAQEDLAAPPQPDPTPEITDGTVFTTDGGLDEGADGDPATVEEVGLGADNDEGEFQTDGDKGNEADQVVVPAWITILTVACVFIIPFLISYLLGRSWRMKDVPMRLGLVLFLAALGLTPFIYNGFAAQAAGLTFMDGVRSSLKLGIDLAGGTNMVFQVDQEKLGPEGPDRKEITPEIMDRMVGAIGKRINPSGTEEVTVRRVGQDRIELIVPGADPEKVERLRRAATTLGNLEFLILANTTDHRDLIERGRTLSGTERVVRRGPNPAAAWKDVGRNKDGSLSLEDALNTRGINAFRFVDEDGQILATPPAGIEVRPTDGVRAQVLTVLPRPGKEVDGKFLTRARNSRDPDSGRPMVSFNFDTQGAYRFQALTSANLSTDAVRKRLAVVLDEEVRSAPGINGVISSSGVIEGDFTSAEVDEIVDVLNAGALEVPLDPTPVSEFTVSPLLGEDTVRKAVYSILGAGLVVLLFMAIYYMWLGLVADLCLVLNLILVLGVMSLIEATFTLPGLAGIVLTIGMAVDANVLIFERIREEQARGSSLRMSIQNGFGKAFSTIVDANVTTLITALILFLIGTDQVRGFAVTLFIGIVCSMFTALYFGRLLCDILERKRWVKSFKMFSFVGDTNIDFASKANLAFTVSCVVLLAGIGLIAVRGANLLDIDFRGGTMVTFQLDQSESAAEVREDLEGLPAFRGNVSVERLELDTDAPGEEGRRFRVRTTLRDRQLEEDPAAFGGATSVAQLVAEAFAATGTVNVRRVTVENLGAVETLDGAGRKAVNLTFSEPIGTTTVRRELGDATAKLAAEQGQPIDDPQAPYTVRGRGEATGGEGEAGSYQSVRVIASGAVSDERFAEALAVMQADLELSPVFDEVNSFDSAVAGEMQRSAIFAILASLVAIVAYIWLRFQRVDFGLAAVAALVHDVTFVLGAVALANWLVGGLNAGPAVGWLGLEEFKINLPMIAALLTVIGYSLNDTIVVFDRIREVRGKNPGLSKDIINRSLNQTLSRTLLTSLTTLIVVGILYVFGGEGIHGFAYCLVVGILIGTYSSLYIATPVLLWLMNRNTNKPVATSPPVSEPATARVA
ncbi:protein translocase subunit SecD [Alienimonas californiensis]|uniref:protein translocase subunit SecD n=1 Tax=Alienimonas californiensis TaxID=2527989 RepID=UPI001F602690|nr:protein translocase subunit SecD [Alienimonas californiensis]